MQNGYSPPDEDSLPDLGARSIIGMFGSAKAAHDAGLAVLAAGSVYWVFPYEGKFALVVKTTEANFLKKEIRIFRIRNRYWPSASPDLPEQHTSAFPTWGFLLVLVGFFVAQGWFPKLEEVGILNVQEIRSNGAWWRLLTATCLHADLGHLIGNFFGLLLFGYFASRYLGSGLAWFLIFLCALLSNGTNALLYWQQGFNSLGASTAVFAGLGLVTGFPIGSYLNKKYRPNRGQWFVPLAGGLMLLGWLGSGNMHTDVGGHLWSFVYGLVLSAALAYNQIHTRISPLLQTGLLFLIALMLIGAWTWALLA